jgi:hypothetical protein
LIVVPKPLPAAALAALAVRRRYLCYHVALAVARGTATLPQQKKNNSEDVQRDCIHIFGLINAMVR